MSKLAFGEHVGALVTFEQVGFSVQGKTKKDGRVQILSDVSGYFEPGTLTAVMGPSGAGKTTFLDIVTGRKTQGQTTGTLLFDGKPSTRAFLRKQTSYVEQFDTLLGVLSVRNMILYQAQLKCDRSESFESQSARVDALIEELGLSSCAHVMIGDSLNRGISGGQAKRTNIAIALVTNPKVMFLDEPTSGLDSQTSCDVVAILRKLADGGRTIMSTIHSPTPQAFQMFDKLLLLHKGNTVYFGNLHGELGAANYFAEHGLVYHPSTNLADFLISETGEKAEVANLNKSWESSSRRSAAKTSMDRLLAFAQGQARRDDNATVCEHNAFTRVAVLLHFRTTANYRFPDFVMPRFAPSVVFGFVICTLYLGVGETATHADEIKARTNIAAALFMCTILPSFAASGYLPTIVSERPLFYRETSDGCYSTLSYLLFKVVEEGTLQIVASLIFSLLTFFVIGLPGNFFWHWVIYFVTGQTGIAVAYFCAALAPDMDGAQTLLAVLGVVGLFFSGVTITVDEIPAGWKWYPWITYTRYAWTAHMLNNFPAVCEMQELVNTPGCPTEYWGIPSLSAGLTTGGNFGALCGLWCFWITVTYLIMSNVRHVKR